MNDTSILSDLLTGLKFYARGRVPMSPALLESVIAVVERRLGDARRERAEGWNVEGWNNVLGVSLEQTTRERDAKWAQNLSPVGAGVVVGDKPYQGFWRCEHHPSAIENYFGRHSAGLIDGQMVPTVLIQKHCEHGCDTNELRWWDNGTCKPATS